VGTDRLRGSGGDVVAGAVGVVPAGAWWESCRWMGLTRGVKVVGAAPGLESLPV